jgi:Zn-dependent protease
MPSRTALMIPYLITPENLALDDVVAFCIAVLVAVLVNAEAQAFAAVILGDSRPGAKDRLHFNAFLHLDILGTLCFLAGGFGWPRRVTVDEGKFKHPRWYLVLARFAGPLGNFLMANIAASIFYLLGEMRTDGRVFLMVLSVNLTVAIYNLIPIPPLAAGSLVTHLLLPQDSKLSRIFTQLGPFVLVAICLVERISHWNFISNAVDPLIRTLFALLTK